MRDYRLIVNERIAEELRALLGDEELDANFLISPDLTED